MIRAFIPPWPLVGHHRAPAIAGDCVPGTPLERWIPNENRVKCVSYLGICTALRLGQALNKYLGPSLDAKLAGVRGTPVKQGAAAPSRGLCLHFLHGSNDF